MKFSERIQMAKLALRAKRDSESSAWGKRFENLDKLLDLALAAEQSSTFDQERCNQIHYSMVRVLEEDYDFSDSELGLELSKITWDLTRKLVAE